MTVWVCMCVLNIRRTAKMSKCVCGENQMMHWGRFACVLPAAHYCRFFRADCVFFLFFGTGMKQCVGGLSGWGFYTCYESKRDCELLGCLVLNENLYSWMKLAIQEGAKPFFSTFLHRVHIFNICLWITLNHTTFICSTLVFLVIQCKYYYWNIVKLKNIPAIVHTLINKTLFPYKIRLQKNVLMEEHSNTTD